VSDVVYRAIVLFFILLGLRLGMALLIDTMVEVAKDVDVYFSIAKNLAQGNGFVAEPGGQVILHRAPLYPVFLTGVYSVFGETNFRAELVAQAVLDAGTGLLVWWVGRRLFGELIGIVAALLFAVYPFSAYYTLRLLPESLFTLGLTALTASLVWAMGSERPRRFVLVGALGALAALVKPVAMGFILFLAVLLLIRTRQQVGAAIPQVGGLLVGFIFVLAPWTLRNYWITGRVIPIATGGGYSLWVGSNLISDGREDDEVEGAVQAAYLQRRQEILAELYGADLLVGSNPNITPEIDRIFAQAALREIRSHPLETLGLIVKKFFRLWFDIYLPHNRWAAYYVWLLQGSLLFLAGYGMFRARQVGRSLLPFVSVLVYITFAHTLIVTTLRYSLSLAPILMVFAVFGLWELRSRLGCRIVHSPSDI
jgi:hypothetical protein